ncbi:MAG: glutathione S-transferase family protein [Burkholderiaceae bacterium]
MVQLAESDVLTREVLQWQGVHLLHFRGSSCSQKTRIYLNLKGVAWESHEVSLAENENYSPWFLGINPRGLLPVLVMNGNVHIESNDILVALEQAFPSPQLIPAHQVPTVNVMLRHEDDLHMDLRTLTFRYTQQRAAAPKSAQALSNYRAGGSGQIQGHADSQRPVEIEFWETVARDGITDDAVRQSAAKFRVALTDLNNRLDVSAYLLGEQLSVLDIAWYVYVNRLVTCGYPVERLHPAVSTWFAGLNARDDFAREVQPPPALAKAIAQNHARQQLAGESLVQVTGY